MYKLIILSVLLITLQVSGLCQIVKRDSIKANYIEFGTGGGFSGASKNYLLTQTGDLYSIPDILTDANTLVHLKKIKNRTTRNIFKYVAKKKIIELVYNEPGNVYHYIDLSINNTNRKLVWGNTDTIPPEPIRILSIKLNNLIL